MNKNIFIILINLLFTTTQIFSETLIVNKLIEKTDTVFQIQDSTIIKLREIDLNTSTSQEPLVSDNQIFSPTDDGLIYCYDLNGNKKWVTEVTGNISSNLVRFKDLILTATAQGDLYSINANNGDVVQVMGVGEKITTDLELIDLLNEGVLSKAVVFGTENGNVFCYDIFSFEMVWQNNLSKVPLVANILQLNDKIILRDNSSTLFCLNSKSGALIWKYAFPLKDEISNTSEIISDGKSVFVLSPNNEIYTIDVLNGGKIWSTKTLDVLQQIYLNYNKQDLILISDKKEIIFINAKDGKESGKTLIKNESVKSFICVNGSVFTLILLSDGTIYRVDNDYSLKELIKFTNTNITSITILSDKQFIIVTDNGNILLFKFN